jgi:DNA-directed RNA polymerase III subunit RPC3
MHLSRKLKDLSMEVEHASGSSLKEYLEIMGMEENGLVTRTDDTSGGGSYQVDFKDLTERLQVRLIENIIIEKYGSVACRIWRVLHSKGKLDDKQVG